MGVKLTGEPVNNSLDRVDMIDNFSKTREYISDDSGDGNISVKHYFNRPEKKRKKERKENIKSIKEEELIMIMMPKMTWDAFQELAEKYGGTPAQAIGTALKLLEETLKKNTKEC